MQSTPYDLAYKELFSYPEMVRDLLQGFINQEELPKELDFSTLEKINSEFIAKKYNKRLSDMVWRVNYKNKPIYFLIHLELQGKVDEFMALRIATYEALLLEDIVKRDAGVKASKELPPMMSIVIYTGYKPWHSPTNLRSFYAPYVPKSLLKLQPEASYLLLAVKSYPVAEGLTQSGNLFASLVELEQSLEKRNLQQVANKLAFHLRGPQFDSMRRSFLVYISRVLDQEEQSPGPDLQDFSEIKNMLEHRKNGWKEEAYSEGRAAGRADGMAEGRAEGRAEGKVAGRADGMAIMLIELMTEKFGAISESQTKQIQDMDDEALRQLGRRLLSANSLEELLG